MTDGERISAGIAISIFLHFCIAIAHFGGEEAPDTFRAVLAMDSESLATSPAARRGTGIQSASPQSREEAEEADRKRNAYLKYLDAVDEAIHAKRLEVGAADLIGVARCAFAIMSDGRFSDVGIVKSSGDARLDSSALRAVRAASGVVKRPSILGTDVMRISLEVKYQYGLR